MAEIAFARFDPQEDITAYELALCLPWWKHGSLTLEYAETIAPWQILRHFSWVHKVDDQDAVDRIAGLKVRAEREKQIEANEDR